MSKRLLRVLSIILITVASGAFVLAGAQDLQTSAQELKTEHPSASPSPTSVLKDAITTSVQDQTQTAKPAKRKRGDLVIAPIPTTSPTVGSGLVLVLGYVFKLKEDDDLSPPSTVGGVAAFTSNGSRGVVLGGRLYFAENKYQATFAFGKGRVNYDFFGIGRLPNRPPVSVPLRQGGTFFFGEFMRNIGKKVFVGPRFQHRNLYARLDGEQTPGGFEIPDIDIQARTVALGIHVQRDTRDSTFYPTKGSLFNWTGDFFDQALGSKRQYQTYKLSFNQYRSFGPKTVLAYRSMICSANQNVPFYDLCLYGVSNDLRGYTGGEFQNRRMFATQAEFRRELKGRFGAVVFGGVGGVAGRWNQFRSDQLLPAVGAGLRFTIEKKNHINYRIDWAVGRAGHTLIIGVTEAF
ncbi:MAG TPA: BamA/TamA family outer membrane protein [Pyrinomonadaceae bacterium]|nr:BamA/TamA family outer membrane protein [Pyrinomonadaceae bacterium]